MTKRYDEGGVMTSPIPDTLFYRMMRQGHRQRTGHDLTGYLAPHPVSAGVVILVRTCCGGAS